MQTVSVIIPTHSRPHLLKRAVASAFAAGNNVEVIVVDDASSDETADVCKSIPGIVYVRLAQNLGVAGARSAGVRASTAQFISFLDDDDVRLPGSLDLEVEVLQAEPDAAMVYSQAVPVDESGKAVGEVYPAIDTSRDLFWKLLGQNFIPCGSVVLRRSCLDQVGPLNAEIAGIDDWDLWIRIAERFPIAGVDGPVLHWRRSDPNSEQGTSAAAKIVLQSIEQFRSCWSKLDRVQSAPLRVRRDAWERFSTNMLAHLYWEAGRALKLHNYHQTIRNLRASLQLGPAAPARLLQRHFGRPFSVAMQTTSCNYSKAWSDTKL